MLRCSEKNDLKQEILGSILIMLIVAALLIVFILMWWPSQASLDEYGLIRLWLMVICCIVLVGTGVLWDIFRRYSGRSGIIAFLVGTVEAAPIMFGDCGYII